MHSRQSWARAIAFNKEGAARPGISPFELGGSTSLTSPPQRLSLASVSRAIRSSPCSWLELVERSLTRASRSSDLLTYRSHQAVAFKPRLRQNSLRRMPLLKNSALAAEFPGSCVGGALTFSVFHSSSEFTIRASRRKGVLLKRLGAASIWSGSGNAGKGRMTIRNQFRLSRSRWQLIGRGRLACVI
jgi:hypothetical protein